MLTYTLAAVVAEYATATMATVGVLGVVWGTVRIMRNGKSTPVGVLETHARHMEAELRDHAAKLDGIDEKLGAVREAIGEMHGTVRMLPCVREGQCGEGRKR